MKLTFSAHILSMLTFAIFASGAAVPVPQDVWSPKILYPKMGTIWVVKFHHNVTWDASNPPANISNAVVVTLKSVSQSYGPITLASGFDLLLGRVEIQVPATAPAATDYTVTLYGDSGNISPQFEVTE